MLAALGHGLTGIFSEYCVLAAYLFGSRVDGTANPSSDYDIGVLLNQTPRYENIALIIQDLSNSLSAKLTKDVDIVILNTVNIELRFQIINQGRVIYCTDDDGRTDFEEKVIRDYLDFKPFIDQYYREVDEAVKEGGFYG